MVSETLTGRQKAAMLLMGLDRPTAKELLKGLDPETIEALAVEISYIEAAGLKDDRQIEAVAQEFFNRLSDSSGQGGSDTQLFLDETLRQIVGPERARQIKDGIAEVLKQRDPFLPIRKAPVELLAKVLETEHPQAVAVALSELPPKQSAAVLARLSSGMRVSTVARMTAVDGIGPEAKRRIGQMVAAKLDQSSAGSLAGTGQSSLRKIAVVVRSLEKEVRDQILAAVRKRDPSASDAIEQLMVTWEDLPLISDRSLQGALRGLDERSLAVALFDSPVHIVEKIKSNISERASAMIDEETALMSKPKAKEVEQAREKVLHRLRELLKNGDVSFEEEK